MAAEPVLLNTASQRRVFVPCTLRALALAALVLLAYAPTLWNGFIWDDPDYVEHNVTLRSLSGLWRIWSSTSATPQYYPLVHTSFWIEYHLWGVAPLGYHVDNLLLHAGSVVLLWLLLQKLAVPGSWLIAAIWGVHPVNVESVAWVTERKNVLSGLCYLAAFLCYLRTINWNAGGVTSRRWFAAAALLFGLALLSKTVTATFPAAVLLIIWWKRGRLFWRDVVTLLPLFVAGAALGGLTSYLERTQVGAHGPEWAFSPFDRVLIAGRAVWFYAGKLLLPVPLSFTYPRWTVDTHNPRQLLAPAATFAVLLVLWCSRRRLGPGPITAGLFFVGTLFPALGLANVYPMRYSFVADHFQYLASIGLIAGVIGGLAVRMPGRDAGRIAATALLVALAALTFRRCFIFRDRLTLWQATVAASPDSWMAHTNLGHALHDQGRDAEATVQYQTALQLDPHVPDTHLNVAIGDAIIGDYTRAIAQCNAAIALDPTFTPAYANLAKAELSRGDLPAADAAATAALRVTPSFALAHNVLGHVRQQKGDLPGAILAYTKALSTDPDDADSHAHLADCLAGTGRLNSAVAEYERSLELDPRNAPAWTTLGNIFAATHRPSDANECYRRALQVDSHFAPALVGLRANDGRGAN